MRFVLGDSFVFKRPKPYLPSYQFSESPDPQTKTFAKKKNIHNLWVYLYLQTYVRVVYPRLCWLVFPFSSYLNRFLALAINATARTGGLVLLFNIFFYLYLLFFKIFVRLMVNANLLRFVCYLVMVHVNFRHPDCLFRDFVARKLGLTANNKQPFVDFLLETVINSYIYFEMTSIRYDFWAIQKRKFLSFFLLYREKETITISNKNFLEDFFSFVEAIQARDRKRIAQHKQYYLDRYLKFWAYIQRVDVKVVKSVILFVLKKISLFFFLILMLPLASFAIQWLLLPVIKAVAYCAYLLDTFIKEVFFAIFFLVGALGSLAGDLFSFFRYLWFFLRSVPDSYPGLLVRIERLQTVMAGRTRAWYHALVLPAYKISTYLPTKTNMADYFLKQIVQRNIEPTLWNGDDGFLFVHKQRSVFDGKIRTFMDAELLEYLTSRKEYKYWEYDVEDDLDEDGEEYVYNFFTSNSGCLHMIEQDETDEDEDEDEDVDFWLMYNNYTEYDVVFDLHQLWNSFLGFLASLSITSHLVIVGSLLVKPFVFLNRRFLAFFHYVDEKLIDDCIADYKGDRRHKSLNVWIWHVMYIEIYATAHFAHENYVFMRLAKFPINNPHIEVNAISYGIAALLTTVVVYLWYIWGWYYMAEHFPNEDNDCFEEDMEDTSTFYDDFDEQTEDYGLTVWVFVLMNFLMLTTDASPMRYYERVRMFHVHNNVDILTKIEDWSMVQLHDLHEYLSYIVDFLIG